MCQQEGGAVHGVRGVTGGSAVEEQLSQAVASPGLTPAKRGQGCGEGWLLFLKTLLMNSSCTARRCRGWERLNGTLCENDG